MSIPIPSSESGRIDSGIEDASGGMEIRGASGADDVGINVASGFHGTSGTLRSLVLGALSTRRSLPEAGRALGRPSKLSAFLGPGKDSFTGERVAVVVVFVTCVRSSRLSPTTVVLEAGRVDCRELGLEVVGFEVGFRGGGEFVARTA